MTVQPVVFAYKEIVAGDLRKLVASSNDAPTGGGARDLRLPWKTFRPTMHRIFTKPAIGRGGKSILEADITYLDTHGAVKTTVLSYWPPTEARPTEDRIAQVHDSPALGGKLPDTGKGRVFVLLIKFDDGTVRCTYAYEDELKAGVAWSPEVSDQILDCMDASDDSGRTAQGYYDFNKGIGYCHAH